MASGKRAVYAAIIGNFAIAVTKFIAAGVTGSSAMMAEGIHSIVDTGNGGLLLLGMKKSKRPPTREHPFGYGKEVYYYTLIVAILIFGVGGGISIYEGILHALDPGEMGDPTINYIVLGLAIIFESGSLYVAAREFRRIRGRKPFWQEVRTSKDPTTFTVLFEDTAALAGLVVALVGIFAGHQLEMPVLDGVASIVIGTILCGVASLLIMESKGLLLGESVNEAVRDSVHEITARDPDVHRVVKMMSMHIGPDEVLVNLEIEFRAGLEVLQVEKAVKRIEEALQRRHPAIKYLTVEISSGDNEQDVMTL